MIDLVPLSEFSDRHNKGWRMIAGYPLQPGDYAVTMQSPGHQNVIKANRTNASIHRNSVTAANRKAKKLEEIDW